MDILSEKEICKIADETFLKPAGVIEFARAIEKRIIAAQAESAKPSFHIVKNGGFVEWEPTLKAFELPDGKHPLYLHLSPQPQSADVAELVEALRNLRWAASERDKKNRIRQFDEFMDAADAALAKHGA